MLYLVEIHECNEREPDNGAWMGEFFPDPIEASSEKDAIKLAIDSYTGDPDWSTVDCDPETITVNDDEICYLNSKGDRCAIIFRAKKIIGNNIKHFRELAGMTQTALAEMTGLTRQKICLYESMDDISNITLFNAFKIAQALDIAVEDLIAVID